MPRERCAATEKRIVVLLLLILTASTACTAVPVAPTQTLTPTPPMRSPAPSPTPYREGTDPASMKTATVEAILAAEATKRVACPPHSLVIDGECLSYDEWLARRPRSMEAYGLEYDPSTKPRLPIRYSLCELIWPGMGLPLATIDGEPAFVARPTPDPLFSADTNLREVGCTERSAWDLECQEASPLLDFPCESLLPERGTYTDSGPVHGLVARCGYPPPSIEEAPEDYLYRVGSAFKQDIAHLFLIDGSLRLIKTPAQLRELYSPITNAADAVNYAQLATGLEASYRQTPQREFLYFYDPIDATRVETTANGYRMFLFHYTTCMCEPWVNSEVELQVDRDGTITWVGARPWSMTIGFSCAD